MKNFNQIVSRHSQRLALVFWLLALALQPVCLADSNRLTESNSTEEVCALSETTVTEVPARKKKIWYQINRVAALRTTGTDRAHGFSETHAVPTRSMEIALRNLRI